MSLEIDYKHKDEKSDIAKLAQFINNIPVLGNYVGELYLMGESLKIDKTNSKEDRKNELNISIDMEFKTNPILKRLDKSKVKLFKKLWISLYNKNKLSELLEELVRIHGPINLCISPVGYSREARAYCSLKKSNFDIIFFQNKCYEPKHIGKTICIEDIMELHECKTNACNFFPADKKREMRSSVKNKFEFMSEVRDFLEAKGYTYKIYIPTFYENVAGSQEYLNHYGYDYIEIVPYSSIII